MMTRNKVAFFLIFTILGAFIFGTPDKAHAREMKDFPVVKLRSLDKITARSMTFEASVGSTVKFGGLYIKAQSCRKSPPTEQPESAAFLQIWEYEDSENKSETGPSKWVFSGWMFASSPGLSFMDHPIYDVWVLDCLNEGGEITDADFEEQELREDEGVIEEGQAPALPEDSTHEEVPTEEATVESAPANETPIETEELPAAQ